MTRPRASYNRQINTNPEIYKEYHSSNVTQSAVTTGTGVLQREAVKNDGKFPVTRDNHQPRSNEQNKPDSLSVLWHELLSPMTLIKGYTATLLQLSDAIDEEQKEQYIRGIDTASNRVVRLIENLRDITYLERADIDTNHPISLLELLRQVIPETQNQTTKHVITLHPSDTLPRVKADPEKLMQVVTNLLGNAIKYSPDGGDIDVELRVFQTVDELKKFYPDAPTINAPCAIISVSDNGIGLPEEDLENIFEKFYRASTKLTRAVPGAGLGL